MFFFSYFFVVKHMKICIYVCVYVYTLKYKYVESLWAKRQKITTLSNIGITL